MLSGTRGIGMAHRANEIDFPNNRRCYSDFESNSSSPQRNNPVVSRSDFVVGIAVKQVSLIVFVSGQLSTNGSVDASSRTELLAAVSRLLPKGDIVRILNVGNNDLRHHFE